MNNNNDTNETRITTKGIDKLTLTVVQTLPLPLAVSSGEKEWIMINDLLLAHPHSRTRIQIYNIKIDKFKFLELEREYQRILPLSENRLIVVFANEVRIYHFPDIDSMTHIKTHSYIVSDDDKEHIQNIKIAGNENYLAVYMVGDNGGPQKIVVIDLLNEKMHHSILNFESDFSRNYFILDSDQLAISDQETGLLLFDINLTDPKKDLFIHANPEKQLLKNQNVSTILNCSNEIYACIHHAYSLSPNLNLWKLDNQLDTEKLHSVNNINPFIEPCIYKEKLYFYNKSRELMTLDLKEFETRSFGVIEGLQNLQISSSGRFMISHHNGVTIYQL